MARVSIVVTARDMTGRAFRAINARAHRLGRSFTTAGSSGTGAFRTMFAAIRRGFTRSTTHSGGFFRSIRTGVRAAGRTIARGIGRGVRAGFRAPGRMVAGAFRGTVGLISGMLRDGIGQGLADAFKGAGSNPYIMAGVAVLITAVASFLGAALAGALVMAFGLAFVGLGGFIASKSQVIKDKWSGTMEYIKASWKDAGRAMEPVLSHGIDLMQKLADAFLPHFEEAMRHAQGPMNTFLDAVAGGIKKFGQKAWDPMMRGFDNLMTAFSPMFEDFMNGLGDSFRALGNTVSDHAIEIAAALRMIFGLITTLIDIINFLANVWVDSIHVATASFGYLLKAIAAVIKAVMWLAWSAVDGFDKAFGWIPGLGGKLDSAKKSLKKWSDDATGYLNKIGDAAIDFGSNLDKANKRRKLQIDIKGWTADLKQAKANLKNVMSQKALKQLKANIKDWTGKLAKARADLKKTTSQKAQAKLTATIKDLEQKIARAKAKLQEQNRRGSKSKIKGDIADLQRKIASARRQLNALNGKTARTYVTTYYTQVRNKGYNGNSATGGHAYGGIIGGMARGGLAAAAAGMRGVLVGEQGPEFVQLPTGSRVRSNGDTRRIFGQSVSTPAPQFLFKSSGRRVDDMLLEILREAIHQRGGDPVKVLGG